MNEYILDSKTPPGVPQRRFEKKLKLTVSYKCMLSVHVKLPVSWWFDYYHIGWATNVDCHCEHFLIDGKRKNRSLAGKCLANAL